MVFRLHLSVMLPCEWWRRRFLNHSNIETVPNRRQPGDTPRKTKQGKLLTHCTCTVIIICKVKPPESFGHCSYIYLYTSSISCVSRSTISCHQICSIHNYSCMRYVIFIQYKCTLASQPTNTVWNNGSGFIKKSSGGMEQKNTRVRYWYAPTAQTQMSQVSSCQIKWPYCHQICSPYNYYCMRYVIFMLYKQ